MKKERLLIGVIGAEVNSIEQRQILGGIITQAQSYGASVAVLSNVYNSFEPEQASCCDNQIYDLVQSPDFDALIILSESFVNPLLRQSILDSLLKKTEIPMIMVGTGLPGYDTKQFPNINTSDENDMKEITDHLIEEHGYRNIELLNGPAALEVSRIRERGYRKSLEQHGIIFDPSKVLDGDFWYNSGEALAKQYISGERPWPEALICANDYMAFGVLDAFEFAGVNMMERLALVGYEFIPERNLHSPLLTTYQRNRKALGKAAVDILMCRLRGEPEPMFHPPSGQLIHGISCGCSVTKAELHEELVIARTAKQYADWNLKSQLDQQLTECKSIDEFAAVLGQFEFMIRYVDDIFLCLFDDWHRENSDVQSDVLSCRSIMPWTDHTVFSVNRFHISGITGRLDRPAVYYFSPLFFKDKLFGYSILRYDRADTYDDTYRYWVKSVSNGLEFLRLKADVRYLLQCRTLSLSYDSMTGMYNIEGLRSEYQLMQKTQNVTAVFLRFGIGSDAMLTVEHTETTVNSLLGAAEVIQSLCGERGICGRISEYDFLMLFPAEEGSTQEAALFADVIHTELLSSDTYIRNGGVDSFVCLGKMVSSGTELDTLIGSFTDELNAKAKQITNRQLLRYYKDFCGIRSRLYRDPTGVHNIAETAAAMGLNMNYFNRKYKECFSVSFHQDCIRSRVTYARHLLVASEEGITAIAERCGYTDSKYFFRQFLAAAGVTPKQYRQTARKLQTIKIK